MDLKQWCQLISFIQCVWEIHYGGAYPQNNSGRCQRIADDDRK